MAILDAAGTLNASASLSGSLAYGITGTIDVESSLSGTLITLTVYEYAGDGGVEINGEPEQEYLEASEVTTSGGVEVGGEPEVTCIEPDTVTVIASGGVKVNGEPLMEYSSIIPIEILDASGAGGIKVGGSPVVKAFTTELVHVYAGTGGVEVAAEGELTVTIPETVTVTASGGLTVGGRFYPEVTVTVPTDYPWETITITASGGVEIGGEATVNVTTPETLTLDVTPVAVVVAGTAVIVVIRPIVFETIGSDSFAEDLTSEIFDGWAMIGNGLGVSLYTGLNFNSYAVFQEQAYGAGADGVFLLEGDDDNGVRIRTGMRLKKANFGTRTHKRLRSVDMNDGNDDASVRIEVDGNEGTFFQEPNGWRIPRDLQGKEFVIDVLDFEELSHLNLTPVVLARR